MVQKTVIACDFDDVLIQFNAGFTAFHNREYGTRIGYNDIVSYDMTRVYGCSVDIVLERIRTFCHSKDHACTEPTPGATMGIRYLQEAHTLDIVTNRPETFREVTSTWIEEFFPNTFRAIHFANGFDATKDAPYRKKSDICKEIGACILIDDALMHATEVAPLGIPVLLPDRPWNRDYTPPGAFRVHSWYEIVQHVEIRT